MKLLGFTQKKNSSLLLNTEKPGLPAEQWAARWGGAGQEAGAGRRRCA